MSLKFDYLEEKVRNGLWLGKQILEVGEQIQEYLNAPQEWVQTLPPIKFLTELTDPVFDPIRNVIESIKDFSGIVPAAALLTLETMNGVNKAYNSKIHTDLAGMANNAANRAIFSDTEQSLYVRGLETYNGTLNLPALSQGMVAIEAEVNQIENIVGSVAQKLQEAQNSALQKLQEALQAAEQKKNWVYYRIKKLLKDVYGIVTGTPKSILMLQPFMPLPRGVIVSPVVGAASPNVMSVIGIISQISEWLLGSFFLKAVADFPLQALAALVQTTTSVVCKYFGSVGAEAARYLAASALRANASLVPAIASSTGGLGGAWAFLQAYAPYIILAAIIIIAAIKLSEDNTTVGDFIYVFGEKPSGKSDMLYARVVDATLEETKTIIGEFAIELRMASGRAYSRMIALALNDKKEPTLVMNLSNLNMPITITSKVQKEALKAQYNNYITPEGAPY